MADAEHGGVGRGLQLHAGDGQDKDVTLKYSVSGIVDANFQAICNDLMRPPVLCCWGKTLWCNSMDHIAATSVISKGRVYDHFRSKEALFAEIMIQLRNTSEDQMDLADYPGWSTRIVTRPSDRKEGVTPAYGCRRSTINSGIPISDEG